jgi:cysteine-rich repeat protein
MALHMRALLVAPAVLATACFVDGGLGPYATGSTGDEPPVDVPPVVCGDGKVEGYEECDEGAANGAGTPACRADCRAHECGDGVVSPVEQCDAGEFNGAGACSNVCRLDQCGDGYRGPKEGCDDDNEVDGDGCSAMCALETCGDGIVDDGEECDDMNSVDTDACTSLCRAAACGDGHTQLGEECDDGNPIPTDDCTDKCTLAACGDGIRQGDEQCDDGNKQVDDQCSNSCTLDQLFVFVSSVRVSGAIGGLAGADALCQQIAGSAGMQGYFRAWLSDGDQTPQTRFKHGRPYVRPDKLVVADSLDQLIAAGTLKNPIEITEANVPLQPALGCEDQTDKVWTNLRPNGMASGFLTCGEWTTEDGVAPATGGIGVAHAMDATWTASECSLPCDAQLRLYCVQQLP